MKNILMTLLLLSTNVFAYDVAVRYVYDGDTIMVTLPSLPKPLSNASVRVLGIDAPEMRGKCQKETDAAKEAKLFFQKLLAQTTTITLTSFAWDKYGGRIDANVFIGGVDVANELIKAGLVRPYAGGARASWCK